MLLFFLASLLGTGAFVLVRQMLAQRKLRTIIDRQLRTEQELRESQSQLEQRTLDLMRSNEDLQAFAYSVSHDLQEPVRTQALFSQLLQKRYGDTLPPEAEGFIAVIRSNALRSQEMMRSLLVYSRAGQADRERALVDCAAVVSRVLEDLRSPLEKDGARVEVDPLPNVWGWEDRLQQVFQNLIDNAAKYRKPDTPSLIRISAKRDGSEWKFSVADNGIGFDQQYAEKVFGLFKRLHGQDRFRGSGIGLALCKRIVERHGGRMWAESDEGKGSTFCFTLPVHEHLHGHEPA